MSLELEQLEKLKAQLGEKAVQEKGLNIVNNGYLGVGLFTLKLDKTGEWSSERHGTGNYGENKEVQLRSMREVLLTYAMIKDRSFIFWKDGREVYELEAERGRDIDNYFAENEAVLLAGLIKFMEDLAKEE